MNKKQSKFTRTIPVYSRLDIETDTALEDYANLHKISKSLAFNFAVRGFLNLALTQPVAGHALGSPELSGQFTAPAPVSIRDEIME